MSINSIDSIVDNSTMSINDNSIDSMVDNIIMNINDNSINSIVDNSTMNINDNIDSIVDNITMNINDNSIDSIVDNITMNTNDNSISSIDSFDDNITMNINDNSIDSFIDNITTNINYNSIGSFVDNITMNINDNGIDSIGSFGNNITMNINDNSVESFVDNIVISAINNIIATVIDGDAAVADSLLCSNSNDIRAIIDKHDVNINIDDDGDANININVVDNDANINTTADCNNNDDVVFNDDEDDDDFNGKEDVDDDEGMHHWDDDMMLFFQSIEDHEDSSNDIYVDKIDNNDILINNDDNYQERYYFTNQRDNLYKVLSLNLPLIDNSNDCTECKNTCPFPNFVTISHHHPLDIGSDPPFLDEYINEVRYPVNRISKKVLSLSYEEQQRSRKEQNDEEPFYDDLRPYVHEKYEVEEFKEPIERLNTDINPFRYNQDRNDKIVDSVQNQVSNVEGEMFLCVLRVIHIFLCFFSLSIALIELYLIDNSQQMAVSTSTLRLIYTNGSYSRILAYYTILIAVYDSLFLSRELRLNLNHHDQAPIFSVLACMTFVQEFLRKNSLYYRFVLMILLLGVGGYVGSILSTLIGCSSAGIYLFDD